ncbi:MAG: hypothetical protein IRZ21_06435 [Thermoleophilaceae bacterium]|nr:hypothetical protein [Thermoleophilaceae bacterium]
MRRRLPIALCTVAAALAAAQAAAASPVYVVRGDRVELTDDPTLPADDLPTGPAACARPQPAPARARAAAGPSVGDALHDAYAHHRITRAQDAEYRGMYAAARRAHGRLSGLRRSELGAAIRTLQQIAARGQLSASRMPALFLQLERNTELWSRRPIPPRPVIHPDPCAAFFPARSGARARAAQPTRMTFGDSPLIFQWYPGNGLQIQPLANFGKANGLWSACTRTPPSRDCDLDTLRRLLDDLVSIASRRGSLTAWEYWFPFGGGSPPWISGLTEGTAIQALARGYALFGDRRYLDAARDALGAFRAGPPLGVRRPVPGGARYLEYSFAPSLFIVNGFLQAVIGLHDYAEIARSPTARRLYREGERVAARDLPRADTGAWSLYSLGGAESDLNYHRLLRDFAQGLCDRTRKAVYCRTAARFAAYMKRHPRLSFRGPRTARAGRATPIRFHLSKISCVQVTVTRGGRTAFSSRASYGHGHRSVTWVPRAPGRYRVRLEAADLRNHHTVALGTIAVR